VANAAAHPRPKKGGGAGKAKKLMDDFLKGLKDG
jgi:hypothetical protein